MNYSDEIIQTAWENGRGTVDRDSSIWRQDECGAWIRREHYRNETSEYGWEIENISAGGPAEAENLRPFHRENSFNRNSGKARCLVTADREDIQPTAQIDTPRNRRV